VIREAGTAWRHDLGGGTTIALVQAGTFRTDAGVIFGPVPRLLWDRHVASELDAEWRLLQALNCLLIETPGGRVLVETGIGERYDAKMRAVRDVQGDAIVPALRKAGFDPGSVDLVAVSHLHFDHAGGLLLADGSKAFPRARVVAQMKEWDIALGDNPRIVVSYDQPELRLVEPWAVGDAVDGDREILPGVWVMETGGHSGGHQAIVVRGAHETVGFLGDLFMRPWSANPRWITSFDDFPLSSVEVKARFFAQAVDEDWTIVLSHEQEEPIGRLERDRDRYRFVSTTS
jgi:glyoxylase-like metal-dependent hydrolase (beta-lactamase superfamily II)